MHTSAIVIVAVHYPSFDRSIADVSTITQCRRTGTQVCVQLPTPADNAALLAATAERRLCRAYGPQQQTRRTPLQRSTDGTDRQTYGRTPYRYIGPTAYYASSVHNKFSWYTLAATFGTVRRD